jgi:cytochrome c-type biogenesis protein CcmF
MHAAWKRGLLASLRRRLTICAIAALALAVLLGLAVFGEVRPMTTIGFTLALWVMVTALLIPAARLRTRQPLPAAVLGMAVAHFGVGLATLGMTCVEAFKVERNVALAVGDVASAGGYDFRMTALGEVRGPNYVAIEANIAVSKDGAAVATLHPQKRLYNSGGNAMSEAGIDVGASRDLFAALGDDLGQGRWSVRIQYKPLIRFIWLGAILIALGGGIAALDRRYRQAANVRASAPARVALERS